MIDLLAYKFHRLKKRFLMPFRRMRGAISAFVNKIDDPRNEAEYCLECKRLVRVKVYHIGFSGVWPFYCSGCQNVIVLDPYQINIDDLRDKYFDLKRRGDLGSPRVFDALFEICQCGGAYGMDSPPRCLHCKRALTGAFVAAVSGAYVVIGGGQDNGIDRLRAEHRHRVHK